MPPQKRISALLDLSLASIRGLVCEEALRVARVAVTSFVYDELEQSVRILTQFCHAIAIAMLIEVFSILSRTMASPKQRSKPRTRPKKRNRRRSKS